MGKRTRNKKIKLVREEGQSLTNAFIEVPPQQYTNPMDIPWFREAVERSERILRETPKNSRPTDMQERYEDNE